MDKLLTSRAIIGWIFQRLSEAEASWVLRYAMKVDSNQAAEEYAWLGMVPAMREWLGGRQAKGLRESTWRIENKDYEATLEVLVKHLRRDASGQLQIRIGELVRRAVSHPAGLITSKIEAGASSVCYDGQYFFDTDHNEGNSGSQSNSIQVDISAVPVNHHGSVTAPSVGEMVAAILKGAEQMLSLKDDQGEPMNEDATEFDIMVPISLWQTATAAVGVPVIDGGNTNTIGSIDTFKFNVRPNPRLSWTDEFAMFRTDADTKPFIMQEEVPISVDAIAEGSELEFKEKKHWYGLEWAGNIDFGFWQHACKVQLI